MSGRFGGSEGLDALEPALGQDVGVDARANGARNARYFEHGSNLIVVPSRS